MTRSLIILPFGFPWDWPADCEQQTIRILSKTSVAIAFLVNEGHTLRSWLLSSNKKVFSRISKNEYVFRPIFPIPFHRIPFIKKFNTLIAVAELRLLIQKIPHTSSVFWTFSMQHQVFPDMFPKKFVKIYDCVDDVASDVPALDHTWRRAELRIMRHSDVCFANSGTLYNKLKRLHKRVYKVPVGFHEEAFHARVREIPRDMDRIPKPRIVYAGTVNSRLDFRLVYETAKQTPTYSYVFIGHVDHRFRANTVWSLTRGIERLSELPNVYFLPPVPKRNIAEYIAAATVGIIPYTLKSAFNRHCFPVKTLEYLAVGKPVVTTRITELVLLAPLVITATSVKSFVVALKKVITQPRSNSLAVKQRTFANTQGFHAKIHIMKRTLKSIYNIDL